MGNIAPMGAKTVHGEILVQSLARLKYTVVHDRYTAYL